MSEHKSNEEEYLVTREKYVGPFVTQLLARGRDARMKLRSSRRFRRGLQDLSLDKSGRIKRKVGELSLLFAIRPDLLSWWIGTFFMIGSALFAAGSVMQLYFATHFSAFVVNATYFIGSLFFTSAAYGQLLQAINANIALLPSTKEKVKHWRWWARGLRSPGFLAAASQFIGTIFFNINTFDAFYGAHSPAGEHLLIWVPNMVGSVLFLVSSFFSWIEIYHDEFVHPFVSVTWWTVWFNIIGSIFFQLSAVYGYIDPFSGAVINGSLSIHYTRWGAVCFYLGAHLSNVEIREAGRKKVQVPTC
jgi:hypothetical protein